jgi:hypothetical protein
VEVPIVYIYEQKDVNSAVGGGKKASILQFFKILKSTCDHEVVSTLIIECCVFADVKTILISSDTKPLSPLSEGEHYPWDKCTRHKTMGYLFTSSLLLLHGQVAMQLD